MKHTKDVRRGPGKRRETLAEAILRVRSQRGEARKTGKFRGFLPPKEIHMRLLKEARKSRFPTRHWLPSLRTVQRVCRTLPTKERPKNAESPCRTRYFYDRFA